MVASVCLAQQCDVAERTDCGYMGITQSQCEQKGCCWKPAFSLWHKSVGDTPWCFYPAGENPCEDINLNGTSPGFEQSFLDKVYSLFDANINIKGQGGVVASPDPSTPGGSYYYHWMRDAALTMRTYLEINNNDLTKVSEKFDAYVNWVAKVQKEVDPNGFDVRINPKFELPNGEVFVGGWCRPQTDGPGLRSAALMQYATLKHEAGQNTDAIADIIRFDLQWIFDNWGSDGCDLWEEVRSNDFFWGRSSFVYAMSLCENYFNKIGDSATASKCTSTKSSIRPTLDAHYTGSYFYESTNREQDSSVIHALSSFDIISVTDGKVAKTISTLMRTFCAQYQINQKDNKDGIPGNLMGRYPGDSYAGGNPWQLLTAVLGKLFYQGASNVAQQNGFLKQEDQKAWSELLKVDENASPQEFVRASISAGDAIMSRLYKYVKDGDGHVSEQIDKNNGNQISAKDLTWSFANILSAMQQRSKAQASLSVLIQ